MQFHKSKLWKNKKKVENKLQTVFNSKNKIACIETKVEFIINFYFAIINNLILASTTFIKFEEKKKSKTNFVKTYLFHCIPIMALNSMKF